MKILVIGTGGREHGILEALRRTQNPDHPLELFAAPGNPGMARLAECRAVDAGNPAAVVALARELGAELVVVGPEAPLVAGVADALREAGIPTVGPDRAAARLEGSKSFAKEVMEAAGVPTAGARVCTDAAETAAALDAFATDAAGRAVPWVVKADGLAGGKGVVVTTDRAEAEQHAAACIAAEGHVVLEEYLDGPEASVFCLLDGTTALALPAAQDFKRAGDGDAGPNTGGMGAYSPLEWAPEGLEDEVVRTIAEPVAREMARRGTPFVGVLYVGLALTAAGPRVVEFNVRFGDPDSQAVLARLDSSLADLLLATATGSLTEAEPPTFADEASCVVVLAADGYPAAPVKGGALTGLAEAEARGAVVLHAGTQVQDVSGDPAGQGARTPQLVASGGRVLNIVARGADLTHAREAAYAALTLIDLPGGWARTDIAADAAAGRITL
ncbi:phosphoribosylamine--glycine ligase [Kytococcus aerolatus]|uniref:Phosphoribosylamine--glycine ligase n=1 Tax=Kytococcus aerolatus TaxID=592308 RepID=A0A212U7P4_9MICO|nr:phosphoribosylamine--glycine ligase [Kytococcus aerolatus]SNC74267.1 phosphoribosylamine--glycine ligase [Kytococcus aerolatus]